MLKYNSVKDDCNFVVKLNGHTMNNPFACPVYQRQVETYQSLIKPIWTWFLALPAAKTFSSKPFSWVVLGWGNPPMIPFPETTSLHVKRPLMFWFCLAFLKYLNAD